MNSFCLKEATHIMELLAGFQFSTIKEHQGEPAAYRSLCSIKRLARKWLAEQMDIRWPPEGPDEQLEG